MYGNIFTIEKRLRKAFLKAILIGKINYSRGIVYATNWNYEIIYKNYCASIF